jgi:hypothetical protein
MISVRIRPDRAGRNVELATPSDRSVGEKKRPRRRIIATQKTASDNPRAIAN